MFLIDYNIFIYIYCIAPVLLLPFCLGSRAGVMFLFPSGSVFRSMVIYSKFSIADARTNGT